MDYDIEKDEYMKDWKEVRLGDVCEIGSSTRIFAKDYRSEGIPFFRSKEIIDKALGNAVTSEIFISNEKFTEVDKKYGSPQENDLLLSSVGNRSGIPYIVRKERFYFKDGNLTWFKNFKSNCNSSFIFYWIISKKGQDALNSIMIGSAQKALTISGLQGLILSFPPLPTQQKIAQILSSLDDKIELNNAINKNLEEIAQTLFKQWFVDFEFTNENGEPYKSSGGEMVESELGEIPKGWRVGILGEIANIISGKRPIEKSDVWSNEFNIPLIGASKIMGYTTNYLLISKILIIGRVGTHGVVQKYSEPIWPSDNTLVIDSNNYEYVYNILKIIDYRSLNRGSTQPLITQTDVKNTKIIIAPNEVHNAFERLINAFNNLQNNNNIEIQTLTKLRDELLPKLMSGEVRV